MHVIDFAIRVVHVIESRLLRLLDSDDGNSLFETKSVAWLQKNLFQAILIPIDSRNLVGRSPPIIAKMKSFGMVALTSSVRAF